MKRFTVVFIAAILSVGILIAPAISEARGGFGGHGGHSGFHGRFFFGFGAGFWPGYYGGYYPFYWGTPVVGWPYASYGYGWPYYPSGATTAPPAYSEPEQQQPYYWYYCQNPQGYYPYVKSCPGGWMTVIPNGTPPNQ